MDRALFTTRIANSLQEGYCELFVGSGLSCNAGLPNWKDLLRPIAKAYKYDVDRSSDLPAIAQYIINANCGNRNILTSLISDSFGCHCEPSSVHSVISDMSFKRIWTTNYDSLLEDSFRVHHNVLVVKKDDDFKQVPHKNDITIIKMHGSYDELDSVVLTSSDYDKYFATHPLISEQFSASLVNRSFLFIGYSYNDPDIRSIMTEAQVKLHGTQNHYLITRAPQRDCPDESNKDFEYRQLMFNSWKTE